MTSGRPQVWGPEAAARSRRGAVAGASAEVLTFFFPAAGPALEQRVRDEGAAGLGGEHPHFTRGVAIGRNAGDALIRRAMNDHFDAPWTGTVPEGPGMWVPNGTPFGATFGAVTPYLLTSGSQFRPPRPPAFGSAKFRADLNEIRTLTSRRTPEQLAIALYWNLPAGTFTPPGYWNQAAGIYIEGHALDEREATHVFALMHAALMDALIGCWDAKYHYWVLRPSQADPAITPRLAFPLPNHPSYPAGHSCGSSAAATVLAFFFPDRATELRNWILEAGLSRMYAGIHYRIDVTAGRKLGVATARWAIAIDRSRGLLAAMH